jgi:hypothetical protein
LFDMRSSRQLEGSVAENVLSFLVNALPPGHDSKPDERTINAALSFVCSMQPRDEAEVMLLAQMVVTAQTAGVTWCRYTTTGAPRL